MQCRGRSRTAGPATFAVRSFRAGEAHTGCDRGVARAGAAAPGIALAREAGTDDGYSHIRRDGPACRTSRRGRKACCNSFWRGVRAARCESQHRRSRDRSDPRRDGRHPRTDGAASTVSSWSRTQQLSPSASGAHRVCRYGLCVRPSALRHGGDRFASGNGQRRWVSLRAVRAARDVGRSAVRPSHIDGTAGCAHRASLEREGIRS
jgi:hypothetical protein